jgi:DNA polymerase-3 subunit gamma/tau
MFYTKYRPQKFSQISRPNQAADGLSAQVKSGKTAHAYLFVGPRGTGKTTTARILAKALNCEKALPEGDSCAVCNYCTQIQAGNFTDLIEIDAASNRGIDDIRSLREKVKLAPVSGKIKIYIIDEVHMLTNEAFNALLKTLEEPPKHVVFILCTTEEHKVPETIKSRCQVFKFSRATVNQIQTKLEEICISEDVKVFEDAESFAKSKSTRKILKSDLRKIAKNSNGAFRDAETQLEQFIESGGLYSDDGTTTPEEFLFLLLSHKPKEALEALDALYEQGSDIYNFSSNVIYLSRDLMLLLSGIAKPHFSEELQKLSQHASIPETAQLLNLLIEAHSKIKASSIPQLPLELAVIKYCQSAEDIQPNVKPVKTKPSSEDDSSYDTEIDLKEFKSVKKMTESADASIDDSNTSKFEEDIEELGELLADVVQKWEDIISTASQVNNSVTAILKASRPLKIDGGGYLVLEVMYKFHKERLESTKNRELVEQAISAHTPGIKSIKCVLTAEKPKTMSKFETGDLTDLNVSPVGHSSVSKDNATGFFDGGLPIV